MDTLSEEHVLWGTRSVGDTFSRVINVRLRVCIAHGRWMEAGSDGGKEIEARSGWRQEGIARVGFRFLLDAAQQVPFLRNDINVFLA
jgi:hypothetical protein